MNKVSKNRLCWNCEGSVSMAEEICPFCGVSVVPASLETPVTSNFAPPYAPHDVHSGSIPPSPYTSYEETPRDHLKEAVQSIEEQEPSLDEFKQTVQAVTLLLGGSVFFIFGLALMLFSSPDGVFVLRWDGTLWFMYTLVSIPLLLLGWRALLRLD